MSRRWTKRDQNSIVNRVYRPYYVVLGLRGRFWVPFRPCFTPYVPPPAPLKSANALLAVTAQAEEQLQDAVPKANNHARAKAAILVLKEARCL